MRRALAVFAVVAILAAGSQAQITITANEVPHTVGQQLRYYAQSDSIWVNVGSPGGPQTWDFTAGDTSFIATDLYLNPAQSPPQFSRANVVIQTDQLNQFGFTEPGINYFWLGAPRYIFAGMTTTLQGTPVEILFRPYVTQFPLPLYMGRIWSNPINVDQQFSYGGSDYRIVLNATINSMVDAYGTALVPLGSYDVLRTKNTVNYDLTVYVWVLFVWIPIYNETGTTYNYEFRAESTGPVLGINTDSPDQGVTYIGSMRRLMGTSLLEADGLGEIAVGATRPNSFSIITSYPNPFNAQSTVSYSLPEATQVDLRVFDLLGRQVAALEQGYQEAGTHVIHWAPENLSTGLYFAQLRTGQQVQRHMMIYLK